MINKRSQILNSSLELFAQNGLHATPVSKIMKAANVSNGTFFYHFKTKDELILELYTTIRDELYNHLLTKIDEPIIIRTTLRNIWMSWIIWGGENRSKFLFLNLLSSSSYVSFEHIQIDDIDSIKKNFIILTKIVKLGIKEGIIVDKNVDLLVLHIYTNIKSIIQYNSKNQLTNDDLNESFNMLWRSILNFSMI